MSVRTVSLFSAMSLTALAAPSFGGNLVVNGSFEDPSIQAGFVAVPAGDNFITGWTVTSPAAGQGVDLVNEVFFGEFAYDGNQAIDLTGTPGPGAISQVVPTAGGTLYTLSFAVSSNGGSITDGLTIFIDGVELDTVTSPAQGSYDLLSYNFVAAFDGSEIKFSSNIGGFFGPSVDAVSVIAVPAPFTAAVLPFAAVLTRRRRA